MRVRVNADGQLQSPGLNSDPHFAELTADTTNTISTASPIAAGTIAAGASFGVVPLASAGTLTVSRPGLYLISAQISDCTHTAAATLTVAAQKNAAAFSPSVTCTQTLAGTADGVFTLTGVVSLTTGDAVRLLVTTSAGTLAFTKMRFSLTQLTDVALSVTV